MTLSLVEFFIARPKWVLFGTLLNIQPRRRRRRSAPLSRCRRPGRGASSLPRLPAHTFDAAGPHDGANPERLLAISIRRITILVTLVMLGGVCRAGGDIEWRHRATQGAVTLTANPLGVASRAAFYTARGFTAEAIRPYAEACGFSFGMQNDGAGTLSTRLADWRAVGADGRAVRLRLPAEWDKQWAAALVPEAARIAFRWAQFQADNVFEAGDWIMGMATLETPLPGSFRLVVRYHVEKGSKEIVLDNLACARDFERN